MMDFILFYLLIGVAVITALSKADSVKWFIEDALEITVYILTWPICLYLFLKDRF